MSKFIRNYFVFPWISGFIPATGTENTKVMGKTNISTQKYKHE